MSQFTTRCAPTWISLDVFSEHSDLPTFLINGHGATTIVEYDAASRPVKTIHEKGNNWDPNTITLEKSYDLNSNLLAEKDGKLNSTLYAYNERNWRTTTTFADGTTHSIDEYSPTGMPKRTTDPNGTVAVLTWDDLDRMTYRSVTLAAGVGGGTYERYRYDGMGRLTEAQDDDALVVRHYNALGSVMSENLNGETTATIPDGVGNIRVLGYPSGRQVTITPDALNRPGTIADQQGAIASFLYDGSARVDKRIARPGSGQELTWDLGYNAANRVTSSLHTVQGNSQAIDQRTNQWDRMGNRTQRVDQVSGITHALSYDSVYRLRMSTVSGVPVPGSTTYNLDDAGNRGVVIGLWGAGNYSLVGSDAPVNQYSTVPGEAWTYDNNGNLIAKTPSGGGPAHAVLFYDARNRLVEYQDIARGKVHRYKYDALGRRIRKIVDATGAATTTKLFYAGDRVVEEQDANGALLATYVHGYYVDELIEVERDFDSNGTMDKAYFVSDDSYSVAKLVSATGTVLESYAYDDFGRPLNATTYQTLGNSTYKNRYFFTGREYDFETGLYWYRTRYYDPKVGRFTSRDSIGVWGDPVEMGNGFSYLGNNPWSSHDPYGLEDGLVGFAKGCASGVLGGGSDLIGGAWSAISGSASASFDLAKDLLGAAFGDGSVKAEIGERIGQIQNWAAGMEQLFEEEGLGGALAEAFPGTAKLVKLLKKLDEGKDIDDEELGEALGRASVEMGSMVFGGSGAAKGAGAAAKLGERVSAKISKLALRASEGSLGKLGKVAASAAGALVGSTDDVARITARIESALSKLERGKNAGVKVVGSQRELQKLFRQLSDGGKVVYKPTYRGTLMELADGTTVGLRSSPKWGQTIDIKSPMGGYTKVHIK